MVGTDLVLFDPSNISTGADLANAGRSMVKRDAEMDEGKPTGLLSGSLTNMVKSMSVLVQANLLQNEILLDIKDALLGTPSQQRDAGVEAGETDIPPSITDDSGGGSNFLSGLNKLNPFSSDSSVLLKFVASGLALLGLKLFGDRLVNPLAKMIEFFAEGGEGSFLEMVEKGFEKVKIKFEKFMTDLKDFIERLQVTYETIKENVIETYQKFMIQWKKFEAYWLKEDGEGYKTVKSIVDFFTEDNLRDDGRETTDAEEMYKDFKDKLSLSSLVLKGFGVGLLMRFLFTRAFPIPFTKVPGIVPAARMTSLRAFGLVGLAIYGAVSAFNMFEDGMAKYHEKQQKDLKDGLGDANKWENIRAAIADAVTVDEKKGLDGAFSNAIPGAATGAAAGMAVGLFLGPGGIAAGAFMGALIGGSLGIVSGFLGEENVNKILDGFTDFWLRPGSPFKTMLETFYEAYDFLLVKPLEIMMYEMSKEAKKTPSKEEMYGELATDPGAADDLSTQAKITQLKINENELNYMDETFDQLTGDQQHKKRKLKSENKNIIKSLEKEFGMDIETLKKFNFNVAEPKTLTKDMISTSEFILDDYMAKKLSDRGVKLSPAEIPGFSGSPGMVIADNNNDKSTNIKNESYIGGNLTVTDPHISGKVLAHRYPGLVVF